MAIELWVKEEAAEILCTLEIGIKLAEYDASKGVMNGFLQKEGSLAALRKRFVLGKWKVWQYKSIKDKTEGYSFVRIDNHPSHERGIILTPYSDADVHFHLKAKTIDEKSHFDRIELHGSDIDDFVGRVFDTFYHSYFIQRPDEAINPLLLYCTIPREQRPVR